MYETQVLDYISMLRDNRKAVAEKKYDESQIIKFEIRKHWQMLIQRLQDNDKAIQLLENEQYFRIMDMLNSTMCQLDNSKKKFVDVCKPGMSDDEAEE